MWTCPHCDSVNDRYLFAANNIKRFAFCKKNTAGTAEINTCVNMNHIVDSDQETPSFMGA